MHELLLKTRDQSCDGVQANDGNKNNDMNGKDPGWLIIAGREAKLD